MHLDLRKLSTVVLPWSLRAARVESAGGGRRVELMESLGPLHAHLRRRGPVERAPLRRARVRMFSRPQG